jgi:hypothetical protein
MNDQEDIMRHQDQSDDSQDGPSGEPLSQRAMVCIGVGVVLVVALFWWMNQPAEMSVQEYLDIKGGAWHFRDFRITGTVHYAGRPRYLELRIDNKSMYDLTIKDGEKQAAVWYDPDEFPNPPKEGDVVEVTGHFDSYFSPGGMVGRSSRGTTGIANSITVIND